MDRGDVADRPSFRQMLMPGPVVDGQEVPGCPQQQRGARRTGQVRAVSGEDRADPKCLRVTEVVHSEAGTLGRPARLAIVEPTVWVVEEGSMGVVAVEVVAVEAVAVEAGAGGDR